VTERELLARAAALAADYLETLDTRITALVDRCCEHAGRSPKGRRRERTVAAFARATG